MKPNIFTRLRRIFRDHKKTVEHLQSQIHHADWALVAEQRKADDLRRRLQRVIAVDVWKDHESDCLRVQVTLSCQAIHMCRDPKLIYGESMRQMVDQLFTLGKI